MSFDWLSFNWQSFDWVSWSNPVSIWWRFLLAVSIVNISLWLLLNRRLRMLDRRGGAFGVKLMLLLCAAYVFGCAFRSVLPRTDVERLCLFDTWLSSVLIGRSVATIAELCFAAQWAIVLHQLARAAESGVARAIASGVVPLILLAECFSWYSVITTSYLGNTLENSLWAVTFLLIAVALVLLLNRFAGALALAIRAVILGIIGYAAFMFTIDVPMYFGRWQADLASGKELLGVLAGLHDARTHWVVTHDVARWDGEITWMSLYFSAAVWASLALCGFVLVRDGLAQYLKTPARPGLATRRLSARPVRVNDVRTPRKIG
jgi:hypothetical protein